MTRAGGLRRAAGALFVIRTRWLVATALAVVVAIGALVYLDETDRSEAGLGDLGDAQAAVARALSGEPMPPGQVVIADPRRVPGLAEAIASGATTFRIPPADAPLIGLPERTAMVGIARSGGRVIAIATSAERQRDRDRRGRFRVLLSMLLAAAVMSGFAAMIWKKQQSEAKLAHDLAVAEHVRKREAELDRLSRAATMAALGSGVAHELATPLGVIVVRAEQLITRAAGDERTTKSAQAILEQAEHVNKVVRGLLGLARGAPIAMVATTAQALVDEARALVEHRFQRAEVNLIAAIGAKLPPLHCEPLLLKHAIVNLLLNACEASKPKGTVRIDVHADGKEIAFAITDEGEGITPGAAARAVEPFFTTKPAGTGLGLAIANEIAKTHRGSLEIAPRSPKGTRAWIRIPIAGEPA